GRRERLITVVDGSPIGVEARGEPESLAKRLESTGEITSADRRRLETLASERACSHATAVLALKLLEPAALYQSLRALAREQIAETFEWRTGAYQWQSLDAPPPANAKPFDVLRLIQTRLPRLWGPQRLLEILMPLSQHRCEVAPRLRRVALQ